MTASITGTATNAADLVSILETFLTTNATLVAAGENWTQVWTIGTGPYAGDKVLKGPGLAGTDNIYVGFRATSDSVNNLYKLYFNGMQALLAGSAGGITDHANCSKMVAIYLDSNPFEYWITASGRRFIVSVQLAGTVFNMAYCGFFLPYAAPSQYPTPLFIGGSRGQAVNGVENFRSVDSYYSQFSAPVMSLPGVDSPSYLMDPEGIWWPGHNGEVGPNAFMVGPRFMGNGFGTARDNNGADAFGYLTSLYRTRPAFDGGYTLTPITLCMEIPFSQTFGILDGIYHVPGYGNAAGNTVTISGVDHIVTQNVFRAGQTDYTAFKLG